MKQYMVRVIRDTDEDYADVVVDACDPDEAASFALALVRNKPDRWFGVPEAPKYFVDPSQDVENVSECGYKSDN